MKSKILAGAIVAAVMMAAFVRQQLSYPEAWDRIQPGMSRQEVYALTGPPTADMKDIKGTFWFEKKLTQRQELWIYFEDDTVKDFYVGQRIGTDDRFITRLLPSSWTATSN